MPRIAEIKVIDGQAWARLEMIYDEGSLTIWTRDEIKEHANDSIRDFLIDLFQQWKDRQ